jgi:hypothetical protein
MKVWSGPYERYNFCDFPILISSFDASPNQWMKWTPFPH